VAKDALENDWNQFFLLFSVNYGCILDILTLQDKHNYQEGRIGIPLTSLTLPHFCVCPKPGLGFPTSYYAVVFSYVQCLKTTKGYRDSSTLFVEIPGQS
jgi:hypothetical protein